MARERSQTQGKIGIVMIFMSEVVMIFMSEADKHGLDVGFFWCVPFLPLMINL